MLLAAAREEAHALEARGVRVTDLERGWVAFPSVIDGQREVLLSWRLGERDIRHFHELQDGPTDRKPVEGHRFFRQRQLGPPPAEP